MFKITSEQEDGKYRVDYFGTNDYSWLHPNAIARFSLLLPSINQRTIRRKNVQKALRETLIVAGVQLNELDNLINVRVEPHSQITFTRHNSAARKDSATGFTRDTT